MAINIKQEVETRNLKQNSRSKNAKNLNLNRAFNYKKSINEQNQRYNNKNSRRKIEFQNRRIKILNEL